MPFDGTLKFDTAIDQKGFKAGLSGLGSIASAGMAVVTGAVAAGTAAVAALGTKAVSVGKEFESGMSQVQATLGISINDVKDNIDGAADTMAALTAKAEEMGAATAFTAAQAAEGLNILAMSGYDAESSIGMIENVLNLASAGSLSLSDAASYAAGSMKGFVSEAENFVDVTEASAYYADMIAKGATLAATDVSQLGEAMSQAAATADMYGQSSKATEAALLRLAEQNETGSNAATMLAATMKNLYAPTDQAKIILEDLGVSAFEASGKARDFNEVVDDLDKALDLQYADDAEAKIGAIQDIFGIQGAEGFSKLITASGETVEKFYTGLEDASGSAAQQAETMLDNLSGDLTLLESAADGLYNTIYGKLNDPLRDLAQTGGQYLSTLSKAFEVGGFEGAADALGGILSQAVTKLNGYLPDLIGLGSSVLESLVSSLTDNLPALLESGEDILDTLLQAVSSTLPKLADAGVQIIGMLGSVMLENLPLLIDTAEEILGIFVGTFSDPEMLTGLLDAGLSILGMLGKALLDNLSMLIGAAIQIVQTIGVYLAEHAPELAAAALSMVKALTQLLIDNLPMLITAAADIITAICDGITENTADLLIAVEEIADVLLDNFGNPEVLGTLFEAAGRILAALIPAAGEAVGDLTMFAIDLCQKLGEAIAEIDWAELGLSILNGLLSGLMGDTIDLKGVFADFGDNWVTGIKGAFGIHSPSRLMRDEVGKYLALGIGEGFTEEMPDVGRDALGAFDRLRSEIDPGALRAVRSPAFASLPYDVTPPVPNQIIHNYNSTVTNQTSGAAPDEPPPSGDIIIPVNIGGEQLDTIVIRAAQIANARSGGVTL